MKVKALDFAERIPLELQRSIISKSCLSLLVISARNPFDVSAIEV